MPNPNNNDKNKEGSLSEMLFGSVGSLFGVRKRVAEDRNINGNNNEDEDRRVRARIDALLQPAPPTDTKPLLPAAYCGLCLNSTNRPTCRIGVLAGCGHCFHKDCYRRWEDFRPNQSDHVRCPICDTDDRNFCKVLLYPSFSSRTIEHTEEFADAEAELSLGNHVRALVEITHQSPTTSPIVNALDELIDMACVDIKTRIPICLAGGIQGCLRCIKSFPEHEKIQLYACQLLGNLALADFSTERIEIAIAQHGGIEAIVDMMKRRMHDANVQEQGCFSLGKIICEAEFDMELTIQVILQAMNQHPDEALVQTYAGYALATLCARDDPSTPVDLITKYNGVDILLSAMQNHPDDTDVVESAVSVMVALVNKNARNCQTITASGGVALLIKEMEQHMNNADVQTFILSILESLLRVVNLESTKLAIANAGGVEIILKAMSLYADNYDIHRNGVDILVVLSNVTSLMETFRQAKTGVLRSTLDIYSDDRQLVERCKNILEKVQ